ncbi:MAG: hypothetical protein K2W95_33960 [Candidatus Obscuribacterales bacterium]|nr:hypothetical protein [Candidatus Obscuribacterales bacterium]
MVSKINARRTSQNRHQHGQASLECVAVIFVMTMLVVGALLLLVNTSLLGSYNYRLNAIAADGARQFTAGMWFLGMKRRNFDLNGSVAASHGAPARLSEGAIGDVRTLITEEVKAMGWTQATVSNLKVEPHTETVAGHEVTIVKVDFDVSNIEILSGGILPTTVTLHATAISSDAQYAVDRHGMALLHTVYPDPLNPGVMIERAIRVPVYNATIGQNTPASKDPRWLQAGDSIGQSPTVEIALSCANGGELARERTNPSGTGTQVLERRRWDPINPRNARWNPKDPLGPQTAPGQ